MEEEIPIKTQWLIVDKGKGMAGRIWLDRRDKVEHRVFEVWMANWWYTVDGSAPWYAHDWFTNYRSARDWLVLNGRAVRQQELYT